MEELEKANYSASITESFISPLKEISDDMSKYQEMILNTLDMDQIARGNYLIKAEFSDELSELKTSLDYLEAEMQKELDKVAKELNLEAGKTVKLETMTQYGHNFRISNKKVISRYF